MLIKNAILLGYINSCKRTVKYMQYELRNLVYGLA